MIENSFIFLDKITHKKEKELWGQGINSWKIFTNTKNIAGISKPRKASYDLHLEKAKKNLKVNNLDFFAASFPKSEHWRLYNKFHNEALFIDIETTFRHDITLIGLYDGESSKVLVKGHNLEQFKQALQEKKLIITFNGASFDIPILERFFGIKIKIPHIDLRHVCSKIGLKGGLKAIEQEIGIKRPSEVSNLRGGDAGLLWQLYRSSGNSKYLKQLITYNKEDTVNLEILANRVIPELWRVTTKK